MDSNGIVTAISTGIAVITASTNTGGYTASCTVTVIPQPPSVRLTQKTALVYALLTIVKGVEEIMLIDTLVDSEVITREDADSFIAVIAEQLER